MNCSKKSKYQKRTLVTLLVFFAFTFLHSELGFLNFDHSDHNTHDYCEIIKNININSTLNHNNVPKPELKKAISFHSYEVDLTNNFIIIPSRLALASAPLISNEVYLQNKILLI